MAEFLIMGGYGGFVWAAFAATFIVLIGLLLASLRTLKGIEARLAELDGGRTAPGERGR